MQTVVLSDKELEWTLIGLRMAYEVTSSKQNEKHYRRSFNALWGQMPDSLREQWKDEYEMQPL